MAGRPARASRPTRRAAGSIGAALRAPGPQLKESIKAFWAPGLFWEELDWAYVGVIDGHDVRARPAGRCVDVLAADRPVVVHVPPVKGKGFAPAEDGGLEGMEKWHAAKPKSIANGVPAPAMPRACQARPAVHTAVFGQAMIEEVRRDRRVVGITAAMNPGTGLNLLQKAEPDHYFDVGIAEQQAVLFAAGSRQGLSPCGAIYSTFLQRAFDQIVHDVCLQSLNVVFAMDRAGLVGDDGPTHHARRHRVPALPAERRPDGAPRRGDADPACRAPRSRTTPGPSRCATRAARASASRCRARWARSGSAPARSCARAPQVAIVGYGTGVQKGLEAAAARRGRHRRHRRGRPLRQAARFAPCSPTSPPSTNRS